MMCIILVCLSYAAGVVEPERPANQLAWLATLLDYERHAGRNAWSWNQLQSVRHSFADPTIRTPWWKEWVETFYAIYLNWYPLVLILLCLLSGLLILRAWRTQHLVRGILFALLWFVLLYLGHTALQGTQAPVAVVKQDGVMLREGNGLSYRTVNKDGQLVRLPMGCELEITARRENGWVQVKQSGSLMGWLPEEVVFIVD